MGAKWVQRTHFFFQHNYAWLIGGGRKCPPKCRQVFLLLSVVHVAVEEPVMAAESNPLHPGNRFVTCSGHLGVRPIFLCASCEQFTSGWTGSQRTALKETFHYSFNCIKLLKSIHQAFFSILSILFFYYILFYLWQYVSGVRAL